MNCGGKGTNFLFFPPEVINPCTYYEWEAIVLFDDNGIVEITVPLCGVEFISPPIGSFISYYNKLRYTINSMQQHPPQIHKLIFFFLGNCSIIFDDSNKNCGEALEEITVECRSIEKKYMRSCSLFLFSLLFNFKYLVGRYLVER